MNKEDSIPIKWIEDYIKKFMAPLYEKGEFSSDCPEAKFAHNLTEMITYYINTCEDED